MHHYKGTQMGNKEIGLFFIFFTCFLQYSYALHIKTLLPDHNLRARKTLKHDSYGIDVESAGNERTHITASNKIAGGGGSHGGGGNHGGNGGGSHGGADNGNGGNSGQGAGGGAVIPVIVAGAANNNHHQNNRHGAATRNCISFPVLILINMASLIYSYPLGC